MSKHGKVCLNSDDGRRARGPASDDNSLAARPLRAAFLANGDPRDVNLWSGTPFYMLSALEERVEVTCLIQNPWPSWYRPLGRALKMLSFMGFEYTWSEWYSRLAAQRTIRRLRASRADIIFIVAFTDMAYLITDVLPVVCVTDAVIPDLLSYYDMYQRTSSTAKRKAVAAERRAFQQALLVQFPSRWASRSAIERQGVPEERVVEIAWGANMPFKKRTPRRVGSGAVRLLFVGGDWQRKGGQIALEAVVALTRRGLDCRLDVVGCTAAVLESPAPSNVSFHGFIDKATTEGSALLESLYENATVFILPSLAEAYGIVFAEAAHHGLPVLAYATGGVPTVVLDGKTGILLPLGAKAEEFADRIEQLVRAPARYEAMSQASLEDAEKRLNWSVWAEKFETVTREAVGRSMPHGEVLRAFSRNRGGG